MTKPWIPENPKALVIGHDPRLNKSDTLAEYSLFADYFFNSIPTRSSEKKKYELANSLFNYITTITSGTIKPEELAVTNLCNNSLPHAPKRKTVLIQQTEAGKGIDDINRILSTCTGIKLIFAMSLQVNYWLQRLGFYSSEDSFCNDSEPREIGLKNDPPYFIPKKGRTFLMICGNEYTTAIGKQKLYPILHIKTYPPKGRFIAYANCYENLLQYFK